MTGGALPPGLVTLKVSVLHWVRVVAAVLLMDRTPCLSVTAVAVDTTGPVMLKEIKSRRS